MMNLETHKAMYEGFLGHLWTKNSGRLLWMTHPVWPSNTWRMLNTLQSVALTGSVVAQAVDGADNVVTVALANRTAVPALNAKLTLVDAQGKRVLPAFYSDNYVALLPGEEKRIDIRYPKATGQTAAALTLREWNVAQSDRFITLTPKTVSSGRTQ